MVYIPGFTALGELILRTITIFLISIVIDKPIRHTMASDIITRELKQPINLVEYLYRRLHEVGVRSVHGVPGKLLIRRYELCRR